MGYGSRVPIDILAIYQLHFLFPKLDLLVVDEFLRLNAVSEESIDFGKNRLIETFHALSRMYDYQHSVLFSSHFMSSSDYETTFKETSEEINNNLDLLSRVISTVPENRRTVAGALDYPIHELACVKYLSDRGYKLKIGPTREKQYDEIMQELEISMNYSYLLEAYAVGSKTADEVIHYMPDSRGPNGGQRIFFDDAERLVKQKLQMGCDAALRYLCKIASASGYLLDKEYMEPGEIEKLYGRGLKKRTKKLVIGNIIKPFKEAAY
tara:strand:- start:556 stop:1353 length:798 start_codon:yes stop_codon:yes gene_type:complete